jgi:hypothetical protein
MQRADDPLVERGAIGTSPSLGRKQRFATVLVDRLDAVGIGDVIVEHLEPARAEIDPAGSIVAVFQRRIRFRTVLHEHGTPVSIEDVAERDDLAVC